MKRKVLHEITSDTIDKCVLIGFNHNSHFMAIIIIIIIIIINIFNVA